MRNTDGIRPKLKQFFEDKGITQAEVASTLDVSKQYVNALCNGRNVIGKGIAEKLEKYYGLSSSWLLTGKGRMIANEDDEQESGLPLVPIDAVGGALSGTDGQWMDYEAERYMVPAFRNCDFLIRVDGDSMYPKYQKGDIVACKRVPLNDIWFQWGKVYVVDTRQGALVKFVEPGNDDEHITLASENQRYKPFQLPLEELNGVAIVKGLIRVE